MTERLYCVNAECPAFGLIPDPMNAGTVDPRRPDVILCRACYEPLSTEPTEPHVNVFRMGTCLSCGAEGTWYVIAVPELATGLQHPQYGTCNACEATADLTNDPPFKVEP